ncbi:MAG: B12-binding domain-containing radical SAM protein [Planctomycetota bacterium]|jgi:radical SAM superfamily enzyme YgiQ (UPF0313 family)
MELPRRGRDDIYLPDGTFTRTVEKLSQTDDAHDLRIGIVYAFDFRTRMLPYWYADKRMAPCSVRTLADTLNAAGFRHVRVILQQWTPNFRPSLAEIDGRPLDLLLVSAMQVHAEPSYDLVRDACELGEDRPLIFAGGPKAIYEPTDYFELGPRPGVGADCVVTGEAFVLLDLLNTVIEHRATGESLRKAFNRCRGEGALNKVPGLVYLDPDGDPDAPVAINTGVQRLLRDLDEMPMPDAGYRLLEPPHRQARLRPRPYPANKVGKRSIIASVVSTHGCKFNCSFCPIPAVNQRTWRYKSPKRFAAEIKHIYEQFGIREIFGTDDNFFNDRDTVEALMGEMARTQTKDGPLGKQIRFYTEATQFDVHKNQDLLPLCAEAGLSAIWFGIEDILGELVNKGQNEGKTAELFNVLWKHKIEPAAMMIHSDDQPLRSASANDLTGLLNQARYLFNHGAVSYQCTYLGPAVGTRDFEAAVESKALYESVNGQSIPEAFYDGNHVVSSTHPRPWQKQWNVMRGYATFYNPINTLRSIMALFRNNNSVSQKRLLFQFIGQIGLVLTVPRLALWARQLKRGPIKRWEGLQTARIPMVQVEDKKEVSWAVAHIPSLPVSMPAPKQDGDLVQLGVANTS